MLTQQPTQSRVRPYRARSAPGERVPAQPAPARPAPLTEWGFPRTIKLILRLGLSTKHKIVLTAIATHADYETGNGAWPSLQTLCRETDIKSRETVRRLLKELLQLGLIRYAERTKGGAGYGGPNTNCIDLDLEAIEAAACVASAALPPRRSPGRQTAEASTGAQQVLPECGGIGPAGGPGRYANRAVGPPGEARQRQPSSVQFRPNDRPEIDAKCPKREADCPNAQFECPKNDPRRAESRTEECNRENKSFELENQQQQQDGSVPRPTTEFASQSDQPVSPDAVGDESYEEAETSGAEAVAERADRERALEKLLNIGVAHMKASELVQKHKPHVVFESLRVCSAAHGLKNPPGFVIADLEKGEALKRCNRSTSSRHQLAHAPEWYYRKRFFEMFPEEVLCRTPTADKPKVHEQFETICRVYPTPTDLANLEWTQPEVAKKKQADMLGLFQRLLEDAELILGNSSTSPEPRS